MNTAQQPPIRPIERTPDLIEAILQGISRGRSLPTVCEPSSMPLWSSVIRWISDDQQLENTFTLASEIGRQYLSDRLVDIADEAASLDSDDPPDERALRYAKLRIDTRLKLLSKWKPMSFKDMTGVLQTIDHYQSRQRPAYTRPTPTPTTPAPEQNTAPEYPKPTPTTPHKHQEKTKPVEKKPAETPPEKQKAKTEQINHTSAAKELSSIISRLADKATLVKTEPEILVLQDDIQQTVDEMQALKSKVQLLPPPTDEEARAVRDIVYNPDEKDRFDGAYFNIPEEAKMRTGIGLHKVLKPFSRCYIEILNITCRRPLPEQLQQPWNEPENNWITGF